MLLVVVVTGRPVDGNFEATEISHKKAANLFAFVTHETNLINSREICLPNLAKHAQK